MLGFCEKKLSKYYSIIQYILYLCFYLQLNMSNIPIPTTTTRAIDLPAQTKLLYREPVGPKDREDLKRKLEAAEQVTRRDEKAEEVGESEASSSQSESEEEEEELMRELARIKQERAEAALKRQAEQTAKEEAIADANPLIGASALRRRWDDDTVFRGQAAKPSETKKNTFVNDSVRSQSHKKFLTKYVV